MPAAPDRISPKHARMILDAPPGVDIYPASGVAESFAAA